MKFVFLEEACLLLFLTVQYDDHAGTTSITSASSAEVMVVSLHLGTLLLVGGLRRTYRAPCGGPVGPVQGSPVNDQYRTVGTLLRGSCTEFRL